MDWQDVRRRIAIAAAAGEIFETTAASLIDVLRQRGVDAFKSSDGDRDAMPAGLLIMVGHGLDCPKWAAQFSGQSHRPRTLLWQLEPLPPPGTTEGMHSIGRQLVRTSCHSRVVQSLLRRWHAARLRRALMQLGGREWRLLGDHDAEFMMRQASWLQTHAVGAARWIDDVVCSTPTRVEYLRQQGIASRFVPIGYDRRWGDDLRLPRDIDVLFIGRLKSARRAGHVRDVFSRLKRQGFHAVVAPLGTFGETRTELLSRSKIVLNVLKFPWEFPSMRLLMALGCGALIVSDRCADTRPWIAGEHFVPVTRESTCDTLVSLLNDDSRREALARVARDSMLARNTIAHSAEQMLGDVGSDWLATFRAA